MGRHLKTEEWEEIFVFYREYLKKNITKRKFKYEYLRISKRESFSKEVILNIRNKFKKYNLGMSIESKSGKAPKKGKGSGRPRKIDKEVENQKRREALKKITRDQLEFLITNIFYGKILERNDSKDLDEAIEKFKKRYGFSVKIKQIIDILGIKKSTYYYRLKKSKNDKKVKKIQYEDQIKQAFRECKGRYGRERLALLLKMKFGVDINYRTLGRYMNKLGLFCEIRRAKRKREHKVTNVKFQDLVQRDYDGKFNDVYATDVTYIPSPSDVLGNHVYLSAVIHHKTKKIVSWNLSRYNDNNLVLEHIKQTNFPNNFIIHSDHGFQYSSNEYINFVK
ncbi:IS3 family transposase [Mycoplasma sp. CSL7475-4]|uniref:IS3 family transposase n=1 Tax=Mycoplasma sp. CSL7475-4 TaxID=2973942 RepID=UPI00216ADF62|nr:IS3 family transposase [Mycoplasma sp. CSL7475-4]MCS4536879.1 IS3 family transposase [Mycoplasma sp. CSL7475-4]